MTGCYDLPAMSGTSDPLVLFQERLGHRFREPRLIAAALTHRSFAHEQDLSQDYERLEFLGDAVLGLVAADFLYQRYPEEAEGRLSRLKSYIVSEPVLATHAVALDLGTVLRLGVGEERSGGRRKRSLLADALEAVFGAVYLDGGLQAAEEVLRPLLDQALEDRPDLSKRDAKTVLQELAQARGWELPEYRHVADEGPDHENRFAVECWLDGERVGQGEGLSKKQAEQRAAGAALEALQGS
jgi:ribonuclease-3